MSLPWSGGDDQDPQGRGFAVPCAVADLGVKPSLMDAHKSLCLSQAEPLELLPFLLELGWLEKEGTEVRSVAGTMWTGGLWSASPQDWLTPGAAARPQRLYLCPFPTELLCSEVYTPAHCKAACTFHTKDK